MANGYGRSSIINDMVGICAKLSWQGSLISGAVVFVGLYWIAPGFVQIYLDGVEQDKFHSVVVARYGVVITFMKIVGIAGGAIGIMFGLVNFLKGDSSW